MVPRTALTAAVLVLAVTISSVAPGAPVEYPLESPTLSGTATGYWHLEHVGDRIWLVAPDGKVDFMRSVALLDSQPSGASGRSFRSYGKVILVSSGGVTTVVTAAAEDNLNDALMSGESYTLKNVGDTIYIGAAGFRPEYTFFQMSTKGAPGAGGAVLWSYYSNSPSACTGTPPCWVLINGNGKPATADTLNSSDSFYFDIGNDSGTNPTTGLYAPSAEADIVQWFASKPNAPAWPADFVSASIPSLDPSQAYWWIKGVVTGSPFSVPPQVLQIAEEPTLLQTLTAKYGNNGGLSAGWANNDGSILISKGWNAAGQYSYRYGAIADPNAVGNQRASLSTPLPLTSFPKISDLAMAIPANRLSLVHPVKNDYVGLATNEACGGPEIITPDVFDPHYFDGLVRSLEYAWGLGGYAADGSHPPDAASYFAIVLEEGDDLGGINRLTHQHLGFTVAAEDPYQPSDPTGTGVASYSDPVLYAKLALRDFLKKRYRTIAALNAAWGTAYTTWDTSSGCIETGTNAWGWGSGLLDEDGTHLLAGGSCACVACTNPDDRETYNEESQWFANPAIRDDLDDFVAYYARQYAQTVRAALDYVMQGCATDKLAGCTGGLHLPPVFLPLYDGPDQAYTSAAPYVDGFWINPGEPASCSANAYAPSCTAADAQRIVDDVGDKALMIQDYSSSGLDSPLSFIGTVSSTTYNSNTGVTSIVLAPAIPYWYGSSMPVEFPDASGCPAAQAMPSEIAWNQTANTTTLAVAGNFAGCLSVGDHVQPVPAPYMDAPNRAAMGAQMASRVSAVMNLANYAGVRPVVGVEHWDLYDEATFSSNGPGGASGLATDNDNFYDGTEATTAACIDSNGYPCGGEQTSYGDLFGNCASQGTLCNLFSSIYSVLR